MGRRNSIAAREERLYRTIVADEHLNRIKIIQEAVAMLVLSLSETNQRSHQQQRASHVTVL